MKFATRIFDERMLRFIPVAAINTVTGYLVYAAMLWIGLNYALASVIATIVGVFFNFKTTGKLVFDSSDNRLLIRFVVVYLIVLVVNVSSLSILTRIGLNAFSAGLIMVVPAGLLSFALNRTFVFRSPP